MGICYKLILEDEFDWYYVDKGKEETLKEFEDKWDGCIERVTSWDGFVVYDINKSSPFLDERLKLIREYADYAYYITDLGAGITKLELPRNKSSVEAYLKDIEGRRTDEEKRASEELCRERILKKFK